MYGDGVAATQADNDERPASGQHSGFGIDRVAAYPDVLPLDDLAAGGSDRGTARRLASEGCRRLLRSDRLFGRVG